MIVGISVALVDYTKDFIKPNNVRRVAKLSQQNRGLSIQFFRRHLLY